MKGVNKKKELFNHYIGGGFLFAARILHFVVMECEFEREQEENKIKTNWEPWTNGHCIQLMELIWK